MSQKPPALKPIQQKPVQQITPAPINDPTQPKPKRKCSEQQLQALKAGREKSALYHSLKKRTKKV
jgi:hypothetical protein